MNTIESYPDVERPAAPTPASPDGPDSAGEALGLAPEIAMLRRLLSRALHPLQEPDAPVALGDVDQLSRVMGRLATLVTAHRRATGATGGQSLNDVMRHLLSGVGDDVGIDLT